MASRNGPCSCGMGVMEVSREMLAAKFESILPHLDERQRRLLLGAEARALGRGGIRLVARAAGVREATVSLGVGELEAGAEPLGRARRPGGGRKRAAELDPGLVPALLALVEPDELGDPVSPLRWTTKSTRRLAGELTRQGHRVSADTVAELLRARDSACRAARGSSRAPGTRTGMRSSATSAGRPPRSSGRRRPGDQRVTPRRRSWSVNYARTAGASTGPKGRPVSRASVHDFPDPASSGKAVPYGIYDLAAERRLGERGHRPRHRRVRGGVDPPLVEHLGGNALPRRPAAADHRRRRRLQRLPRPGVEGRDSPSSPPRPDLPITVCHFPPGTSKWNKIEHRLFSHITMNWRGRPLTSHEVIVRPSPRPPRRPA